MCACLRACTTPRVRLVSAHGRCLKVHLCLYQSNTSSFGTCDVRRNVQHRHPNCCMKRKLLVVIQVNVTVFWDVTPCRLVVTTVVNYLHHRTSLTRVAFSSSPSPKPSCAVSPHDVLQYRKNGSTRFFRKAISI